MKFFRTQKGFTLIELMIVVAILAILSVVAVPAFIKYMRKAKTSEAVIMLEKVYAGAATYYSEPRTDKDGVKIACQFPATEGYTPQEGGCCAEGVDADDDDRCDANADAWNSETWNALKFQISEQHYFVYSFDSTGTLDTAEFFATANADLDCDGTVSTFQRTGKGDPNATGGECAVIGAAAPYIVNETE